MLFHFWPGPSWLLHMFIVTKCLSQTTRTLHYWLILLHFLSSFCSFSLYLALEQDADQVGFTLSLPFVLWYSSVFLRFCCCCCRCCCCCCCCCCGCIIHILFCSSATFVDFIYKREKLLVRHSKQYHKKALVSCYHLIDRTLGFYPHPQSLELPLFSSFHLTGHTFYTFTVCHLVHWAK